MIKFETLSYWYYTILVRSIYNDLLLKSWNIFTFFINNFIFSFSGTSNKNNKKKIIYIYINLYLIILNIKIKKDLII